MTGTEITGIGFGVVGACLVCVAITADRRIKIHQTCGVLALAWISYTIGAVILDLRAAAGFFAGIAAVFAWMWWINGGDDDTKKRIKRLRARFTGTRRTAPQAA